MDASGDEAALTGAPTSAPTGVRSRALGSRSWPGVPSSPTVLVPTGSTEQHGPHLPFDTDSVIATAVAAGAAAALGGDDAPVLVAPTLPYGASGEHQHFPGTVSIGHLALEAVLVELVRSLATWAGRVVFVNGHGGNVGALAAAVSRMIAEGHRVSWVPCAVPGGDPHAGRTETSLMLHLAPGSVDMTAAVPGNVAPLRELMPALAASGVLAVSATGVLGDPTGATAAEGSTILGVLVADACARIRSGVADDRGLLRVADDAASVTVGSTS